MGNLRCTCAKVREPSELQFGEEHWRGGEVACSQNYFGQSCYLCCMLFSQNQLQPMVTRPVTPATSRVVRTVVDHQMECMRRQLTPS